MRKYIKSELLGRSWTVGMLPEIRFHIDRPERGDTKREQGGSYFIDFGSGLRLSFSGTPRIICSHRKIRADQIQNLINTLRGDLEFMSALWGICELIRDTIQPGTFIFLGEKLFEGPGQKLEIVWLATERKEEDEETLIYSVI